MIAKFAGAGLNDPGEGVGADVEQFIAQQRRETSADFDRSRLFDRLQHSIIPSFGSCSGVPASTPEASDRITSSNVSLFAIILTIFLTRRNCQYVNASAG